MTWRRFGITVFLDPLGVISGNIDSGEREREDTQFLFTQLFRV